MFFGHFTYILTLKMLFEDEPLFINSVTALVNIMSLTVSQLFNISVS